MTCTSELLMGYIGLFYHWRYYCFLCFGECFFGVSQSKLCLAGSFHNDEPQNLFYLLYLIFKFFDFFSSRFELHPTQVSIVYYIVTRSHGLLHWVSEINLNGIFGVQRRYQIALNFAYNIRQRFFRNAWQYKITQFVNLHVKSRYRDLNPIIRIALLTRVSRVSSKSSFLTSAIFFTTSWTKLGSFLLPR